jgi:hypothetical protein
MMQAMHLGSFLSPKLTPEMSTFQALKRDYLQLNSDLKGIIALPGGYLDFLPINSLWREQKKKLKRRSLTVRSDSSI